MEISYLPVFVEAVFNYHMEFQCESVNGLLCQLILSLKHDEFDYCNHQFPLLFPQEQATILHIILHDELFVRTLEYDY